MAEKSKLIENAPVDLNNPFQVYFCCDVFLDINSNSPSNRELQWKTSDKCVISFARRSTKIWD